MTTLFVTSVRYDRSALQSARFSYHRMALPTLAAILLALVFEYPSSAQPLVLNYEPSQPHGWQGPVGGVGMTVGGHTASMDFTNGAVTYRVSLLPFGGSTDAPDPIYEGSPLDQDVKFAQTLEQAFGDHYSFYYASGLPEPARFRVQSYSVFAKQQQGPGPGGPGGIAPLNVGAELYFTYENGRDGSLPFMGRGALHFIQVVKWSNQNNFVDNSARANPYYISAGPTSIYGTQVVNFLDDPQLLAGSQSNDLTVSFTAETFLADDTGLKDGAGKDIVIIYGGIKYGWQVQKLP